jgi:hypothetical protein
MNAPSSKLLIGAVCLALFPCFASAQTSAATADASSCREFVQKFYDWYALKSRDLNIGWDVVLRERRSVLNPQLARALLADRQAQERAQGELVGLDFDPFFGSQDPADHYTARDVHLNRAKCFVYLWRDSPTDTAAKSGKAEVVAEVLFIKGRWLFINFLYPGKGNLLQQVQTLAAERRKQLLK